MSLVQVNCVASVTPNAAGAPLARAGSRQEAVWFYLILPLPLFWEEEKMSKRSHFVFFDREYVKNRCPLTIIQIG
ncbi:hypothetical protein [Marinobacter sp. 3-2]|uniref:hypothetical protein n=1 Tax=Marinobacter sp. 3-2 TaxID=2485141 RepID=UPI001C865FDA|nr:hypothetical protein [Marinobacter sp. 3-2]